MKIAIQIRRLLLLVALCSSLATPWVALALSLQKESCDCCKTAVCAHRKAHSAAAEWSATSCGLNCNHERVPQPAAQWIARPKDNNATFLTAEPARILAGSPWAASANEPSLYQRPPPTSLA
jgi:hypothetical protein